MESGASNEPPAKQQLMERTSAVQVGVRVRPFTSKEISASRSSKSVLTCIRQGTQEIRLGERRFTYDAVFDESVSQEALYQSVGGPLMGNFLEGFNATIMAYGQTGSGKTYTMGSEAHDDTEISPQSGIIPRFMKDLFAGLQARQEASSSPENNGPVLTEFKLTASFLEVYGEDVHDLLVPSRPSVPIREDANGGIVCTGLTEFPISTAEEALQVLHEGTMHRTTAATLMNLTSSRSHAVFAVTLTQTMAVPTAGETTNTTTVSRLTFVDLAGSERMKKTGAEGERAREGIKINEGLLALGNVINALADQKKIEEGKKVYVPYRQSKLTRLLQDALGGNSQTLFLACVSPSDTNANETLSTLHYANRARNIRNAPVQNVDANMLELRRLRAWSRVLQNELLRQKFCPDKESEDMGKLSEEILIRTEVQRYLNELQTIALGDNGAASTTGNLAFFGAPIAPSGLSMVQVSTGTVSRKPFAPSPLRIGDPNAMDIDSLNQSVLENFDPALLSEVNPDHEMAILDQLLELQHQDQVFDDEQKRDSAALEKMEGEIAEQEGMLLQLRESMKVYHNIKNKYENLLAEVQQLETEKASLAAQLEKATADPTQGCSSAIKRKLEKVEKSLARARTETQKHRDQYRKLEKEQQKRQVLERKIADLKHGKAAMIKKQRDAAARHREYTEAKSREIVALKRKERNAEKKVSKLQTEVRIHKRNLEKRQQFIQKLNDKLKETETHLMKLLSTRQRNLQDRMSTIQNRSSVAARSSILPMGHDGFVSSSSSEVKSACYLVDRFVSEKVAHFRLNNEYQVCVEEYATAMKDMVKAVNELRKLRTDETPDPQMLTDALQAVEDTELQVELIAADVESIRVRMDEKDNLATMETNLSRMVECQPVNVLRTLMIGMLDKHVLSEQSRSESESLLAKKVRTIETLEQEIDILNRKVATFSNENAKRQILVDSNQDPVSLLASLSEEKESMAKTIDDKDMELAVCKENIAKLEASLAKESTAKMEAGQKLATLEATSDKEAHAHRAMDILSQFQNVWREMGASSETDEDLVRSIENCLEDTCFRKLAELKEKREGMIASIETAQQDVTKMYASLGLQLEAPSTFPNLQAKFQFYEGKRLTTIPKYEAAKSQAKQIVDATSSIQSVLGYTKTDLPANLNRALLEASDESLNSDLTLEFLSRCEEELSQLRMKKSEILVQNSLRQNKIIELLAEMNVTGTEGRQFILKATEKEDCHLSSWWSDKNAEEVCDVVFAKPSIPKATKGYSDHLTVIYEAVTSISEDHRFLSEGLHALVERAHQTLLRTVKGGHDASEACANFRDALQKLPKLSKEYIDTCLSRISDLILGVDDMIQSEEEALSVVWDALGTPSEDRTEFWETVEKDLAGIGMVVYDEILANKTEQAGWLYSAAEQGQTVSVCLDKKLFKLEAIHTEVEALGARQDAKSKVLSLDSEVRLLNAQLSEFEEKKCSKDRLLSRQTASSHLLREERYRKQMKAKLTSKLEQLSELLKVWNEKNSKDFDPSILSEDVRMLLQNTSWIQERKELMHLRTTKSRRVGKRRIDRTESSESESVSPPEKRANILPPAKCMNIPLSVARQSKRSVPRVDQTTKAATRQRPQDLSKAAPNKRKAATTSVPVAQAKKRRTVANLPSKDPNGSVDSTRHQKTPTRKMRKVLSPQRTNVPKEDSAKSEKMTSKRMTLPPFGQILEQILTPRHKSGAHKNTFE